MVMRYRNRVEFRRHIRVKQNQLSAFVWDELCQSWILHELYRNRLALGVGRRLSRRIAVDFLYLLQNDGYSKPGD